MSSRLLHKVLPPPRPSVFFGRDKLVDQLCTVLMDPDRRHAALLGTGGIGKTSIAKAILNDPRIKVFFNEHLLFIRFDNILTAQITYTIFVDRVARVLGIPSSGNHDTILGHLAQQKIL